MAGGGGREPLIGGRPGGGGGSVLMVALSVCVAACGSFIFGVAVGYSAPTQAQIREELGLSLSQFSFFGSIVTIGAMLGAIGSGRITDTIGRKGAMRASAAVCTVGWLSIYTAQGAGLLDIGRFFTGFGVGVYSYVVPIFIAEIAPKALRGGLTTVNQLLICIGGSVTFIIGTVVPWRSLVLTGLIPCLIQVIGLFFIPESPRWLAKVGRRGEFESALRRLRGRNADIAEEAAEIQEFIGSLQHVPMARIQDLVDRAYLLPLAIGVGLMVFQQFSGINGILFYASETFVAAGYASGTVGTILMALVQIPLTALGAILMDRSGRRPLLLIAASGMLFGSVVTGTSFLLKNKGILVDYVAVSALTGILIYMSFFALGMGSTPWVIMSEIFPINIKGVGGSMVTLVNWFGSWIVSYTFNFLMSWSSPGTFYLYSLVCILAIIFVMKLVPETKGRTLEEIEASLNSR